MSGTITQSGRDRSRPELVAPGGSPAALRAAVAAGADAVYVGLRHLSARAHATNFSLAELRDAVGFAGEQGVRVYVTLNTVVRDEELDTAARLVQGAAEAGAHGVVFQDPAVLTLLKEVAPGLRRHASTQMAVRNVDGVRLLQAQGVHRVVLARELSLAEIRAIRSAVDCEIEVFAHGALCYGASGLCLMSAMTSGRSGNRGRCAQPCRKPYRDARGEHGHIFSPSDIWGADLVDELAAAGVDALKIEGRLRGPEYVCATVRTYRHAIDGRRLRSAFEPDAGPLAVRSQFSRQVGSGFLEGPEAEGGARIDPDFQGHRGFPVGEVIGAVEGALLLSVDGRFRVGDRLLFERGSAAPYNHALDAFEVEGEPTEVAGPGDIVSLRLPVWDVPTGAKVYLVTSPVVRAACAPPPPPRFEPERVDLAVDIRAGVLTLEGEGVSGAYDMPSQADLAPLGAQGLRRGLEAVDPEARVLARVRTVTGAPEEMKVPPKALARVRRDFCRRLELARDLGATPVWRDEEVSGERRLQPERDVWTVRVDRAAHLTPEVLSFADRLQVEIGGADDWTLELPKGLEVEAAVPPRLSEAGRERARSTLRRLRAGGRRGLQVSEVGDVALGEGWRLSGDHTLYAANRLSTRWWREALGFCRVTTPIEADLALLEELARTAGAPTDVVVYGEPVLMYGALTPAMPGGRAVVGVDGVPRTVEDGPGRRFRVRRTRGEATHVVGERPLCWFSALGALRRFGYRSFRVDLTGRRLSRSAIAEILAHAEAGVQLPGSQMGCLESRWL